MVLLSLEGTSDRKAMDRRAVPSAKRALDSAVLDDAVTTQDTVTQLAAQVRRVRPVVPAAADVTVSALDHTRPGKPDCDWTDPDARDVLVSGPARRAAWLVSDALAILDALEGGELDDTQAEAVAARAGRRPGRRTRRRAGQLADRAAGHQPQMAAQPRSPPRR